jgi:MFS family permease
MAVFNEDLDKAGVPEAITYTVLFFASVINGFTVGILWASANQYIADCSSDENKGFIFSYFWCFYMTS